MYASTVSVVLVLVPYIGLCNDVLGDIITVSTIRGARFSFKVPMK